MTDPTAVRSEESQTYTAQAKARRAPRAKAAAAPAAAIAYTDDEILDMARAILEKRMRKPGRQFSSPTIARDYFCHRIGSSDREVFSVLFLDTKHRMIACEDLFFGTIDGAEVHPREVVKRALNHNAAAVIVSHNHPSGNLDPSPADITVTRRLREALSLVNVRLLDHIIVGGGRSNALSSTGHV